MYHNSWNLKALGHDIGTFVYVCPCQAVSGSQLAICAGRVLTGGS